MRDRPQDSARDLLNAHYEDDMNYTLKLCRWVLKPTGIWSIVYFRSSKLEKGLSIITMILWLTYLMFSLIPPSLYLIFEKMSLYFRAKLFGPVAYCLLATIKYVYLVMRGSTFASCITHVERDWRMVDNPIHRTIMLQNASISRKLTTLCAVFLYTAGLAFYTVLPFFSKGRVKGNMTTRPLIYPGYDAFLDTQSSPNYEILYFLQCFSAFIRYNVTVAAFSLAVIFVTHICGQIQIQMVRLEDFVGDKNARDMHPHPLNIIIRDHAAILQFAKNVEEALREIFLTQILESTLTICLLEYYCLRDWESSDLISIITYSIFLISFTFNTFIFCYMGELLSEQCSQIGQASYEIDWYTLPPKKASYLILMHAVSLYPPKLTGGKIFELSLFTFGTVMKTSVVYLNLLRTVSDW